MTTTSTIPPADKWRPILCVDFDGVIHSYRTPWRDAAFIPDPPVPGALAWLLEATESWDVCVYSSRSFDPAGRAAMHRWIFNNAVTELGSVDGNRLMAKIKFPETKPSAFLTIDDRCVRFDGDWDALDPQELLRFQPWNKRKKDTLLVPCQVEVQGDKITHVRPDLDWVSGARASYKDGVLTVVPPGAAAISEGVTAHQEGRPR